MQASGSANERDLSQYQFSLETYIAFCKKERKSKNIKGKIVCHFCTSTHARFGTLKQHLIKHHGEYFIKQDDQQKKEAAL